jgi:hypothetical protein
MHAGCVPPPPGLGLSARYILSRSASVRLPVLITHVEYMGGNLAFEIRKVRTHVLRRQVGLSVPSHSKSYIKVRNCLPTCPTATLVAWRIGISSSRKYASDQITRWSKSSTFGEFSSLLTVRTLTGMTTDVYPRENCLAPDLPRIMSPHSMTILTEERGIAHRRDTGEMSVWARMVA